MSDAVNIVLSRIEGGRTWLATRVGDGRACGIGPTPAQAVEQLFRWAIPPLAEAAPAPSDNGG